MADIPHDGVTLWDAHGRQCILVRNEGRYELHLRYLGRTTTLETCLDAADGRRKATRWLDSLNALDPPIRNAFGSILKL
jgi:hypothetical protein